MSELFFILFAGGIMLGAAVPAPRDVTLHWLRLAGILALCSAVLSLYFLSREPSSISRTEFLKWTGLVLFPILMQLAFAHTAQRDLQRLAAVLAFALAMAVGVRLLDRSFTDEPLHRAMWIRASTCIGVAAMTGLVMMDLLLGHAYLTSSRMTMKPFRRLNTTLAMVLGIRALIAIGCVITLLVMHPVPRFWGVNGLYVGSRWLIGLIVPAASLYLAHVCILRRATQSATRILYVTGVLILLGEMTALHLAMDTGLPF